MELDGQHGKLVTRGLPALLAALTVAGEGLAAQAQPAAPAAPPAPSASDWRALDPENTLVIETTKGRVVVEMRPEIAPLAVARIKILTRRRYYDEALFYRVIKDYMAQTGDKGARIYRSDLANLPAEFTFRPTDKTPFVALGDIPGGETGFIGSAPVTIMKGEAGGETRGWPLYCPGTVAMTHAAAANTANSQFFLMRSAAPALEKTFTAWGRVVSGMDAVRAIKDGEPVVGPDRMTRVRILADIPPAQRPVIRVMDTKSAAFASLFNAALKGKGAAFSICDLEVPVQEGTAQAAGTSP